MKFTYTFLVTFLAFFLSVQDSNAQSESVEFDGSSSYIDLGNNFNFEYDSIFTVEAWIKCASTSGVLQVII